MSSSSQFQIVLGLNSSGVSAGVNQAVGQVERLGRTVRNTLIGIGAGSWIYNQEKATIEWGSAIHDAAGRFGVAAEKFQEWKYAAKQSGIEMEELEMAFKKLSVAQVGAVGGNQDLIRVFSRLNIPLTELKNLNPDVLFERVGKSITSLPSSAQLTADAIALMGRSGDKMAFAFRDGFVESAKAARSLGQVVKEEVINQLDDAGDSMDRASNKFRAMMANIITADGNIGTMAGKASVWFGHWYDQIKASGGLLKNLFNPEMAKAARDVATNLTQKDFQTPDVKPKKPTPKPTFAENVHNLNPFGKPDSDALAAVGIFRGGGGNISIPGQQLTELRAIRGHLETISSKTASQTIRPEVQKMITGLEEMVRILTPLTSQ